VRKDANPALDPDSQRWLDELREGHERREHTIAKLHGILLRGAVHELNRRRGQLARIAGPEFDDLAHQAADDALLSILAKLDEFKGLSRFTTWAYKFVILAISNKVSRHAWQRQRPSSEHPDWEQLPDRLAPRPGDELERRQQLEALSTAIEQLSHRQRTVFVAVLSMTLRSTLWRCSSASIATRSTRTCLTHGEACAPLSRRPATR
jgi:RNA polymerase sigma-70 factor, ECF subfamily